MSVSETVIVKNIMNDLFTSLQNQGHYSQSALQLIRGHQICPKYDKWKHSDLFLWLQFALFLN